MRSAILPLLFLALAGCQSTPEPTTPAPGPTAPPGSATAPPAGKPATDADPADLTEVEAAIGANDAPRAKKATEAALAHSPKSAKAHYYAGVAAELGGEKDAAEKHYRDALALAPTMADAAINLSAILLDTKREADAVALLRPLQAKSPDDPLLASNLAVALSATGDHAQSAAVYGKLVQKGDPRPETRLALAGELIASGKKDEAATALRDGLPKLGDSRDLLAAFGRALAQAGAFPDAIKALDQALKIKASADLLTYRALFKRSLKDLPGARADLEAALKEDPKFAHAHVYLGEIDEQEKKPAEARKAYEKAIEIAPDGPAGKRAREKLQALKGAKK
jgi:Flp pilus assembly protein TadD